MGRVLRFITRTRRPNRLSTGPTRRKPRQVHFGTCAWTPEGMAELLPRPVGFLAVPILQLDYVAELRGCTGPANIELGRMDRSTTRMCDSGSVDTSVGRVNHSAKRQGARKGELACPEWHVVEAGARPLGLSAPA